MNSIDDENLAYKVGGLLYTPALRKGIDQKILNNKIEALMSVSFCLEDSVADSALGEAEANLKFMLTNINPDLHTAPKSGIMKSLQIRSDTSEKQKQITETNAMG